MIPVCIFTYSGDTFLLPLCVEAVLTTLPEAEVYIIDDRNAPIPSRQRKKICNQKRVHYQRSNFQRNNNLRGKQCVIGMLEIMESVGRKSEFVIKLDTDTLLLGRGWLDQFAGGKTHAAGSSRTGSILSGICYALRTSFIHHIKNEIDKLDLPDLAGEDVVIGSFVSMYSYPHGYMHFPSQSLAIPNSRWAGYNYREYISPESYARKFEVLTMGECFSYDLPPSVRTKAMQKILIAWRKQNHKL